MGSILTDLPEYFDLSDFVIKGNVGDTEENEDVIAYVMVKDESKIERKYKEYLKGKIK